MSLFSQLRRRNVHRMAALYAAAAWLVMQVVDVVEGKLPLPDWLGSTVLAVLAIGFPIALILSWFYELTPGGVDREPGADTEQAITRTPGRRSDLIIISILCAAVILFAYDKWSVPELPAHSIAVLAFDNMSGDPAQEYFSDGLSDTLIHVLAQMSGLKVTAKTSSFYFKGKNMDVGEIARKLNVANILEGSVQKDGGRVRVIAQLINAADGTHLWSKSFVRNLEDLFAVQDEIAQEVAKTLRVTLLDAEEQRLAQRYRPTMEAYDELIVGRYEMAKRTADSLAAAERHFKRAIELDPDYALVYLDLAETYELLIFDGGLVFEEALRLQQPLLEKALELDPFSAEINLAVAYLRRYQRVKTGEVGDNTIGEAILEAIKQNPNSAQTHRRYSEMLNRKGRFEDALAQIRLAAELDPMSPDIQNAVANAIWNVGRVEEALSLVRQNIERTPEHPANYWTMSVFQARLGRLGDAQRWMQEVRKQNPGDPYGWFRECLGFLALGDLPSSENCAAELRAAHPEKVISDAIWPEIHEYRGEPQLAIATLEALLERVPGYRLYSWRLADLAAGQGDLERALGLMADEFPGLLEEDVELSADEYHLFATMVFAAVLHANGETERGDILLKALEEQIATMHRMRGVGYGILDVYIHAIRGDRDRAVAALREAIDLGYRGGDLVSWMLRDNWKLGSLNQDSEFIALLDELEADIRRQRQWYEDHRDEPLF